MERLDYVIIEAGIERRISLSKVLDILQTLRPETWEVIDRMMRWDDMPFEYVANGNKIKIEYRGPRPGDARRLSDQFPASL